MQRSGGHFDPVARLRASRRAALDEIGKTVLDRSNERVPRETGELEESGAFATFDSLTLPYGRVVVGYSDSKAVAVHEDLDSDFHDGRQAKYLETALQDSRAEILRIAAHRMQLR